MHLKIHIFEDVSLNPTTLHSVEGPGLPSQATPTSRPGFDCAQSLPLPGSNLEIALTRQSFVGI